MRSDRSFESRYDTVGRSLATARNEAIFLNLVRASHDYPLSFTTIANVNPGLTNMASFGLPNFLVGLAVPVPSAPLFSPGRDVIFGNSTAANTTTISTSFNVSTLETGAFYNGFLKPIDLSVVNYFIRQDYPRELLFWLFTDSVEITTRNGRITGYRYDPPYDYGCSRDDPRHRCFVDFVRLATIAGLTVPEKTLEKGSGGEAWRWRKGGLRRQNCR